jgi:two-component system, LytTR family, response regulator
VFFRASRNMIINLESISDVEQWFGGTLKVTLSTGLAVELSRRQSAVFRDLRSL